MGLALIVITFIACVISFYLIFFGWVVFLVGTLLVLLSDRTIKTKLVATVLPIVLYVPAAILFLYLYNFSLPKTILIPKGYEGYLKVVYNEKCGIHYLKTNGETILAFPKNGILILNEEFDSHINYKYYFVDESGKRTEIFKLHDFNRKSNTVPAASFDSSGSIGQAILANEGNNEEIMTSQDEEQEEISYATFYVYNTHKSRINDNDQLDSVMTDTVYQCRAKR